MPKEQAGTDFIPTSRGGRYGFHSGMNTGAGPTGRDRRRETDSQGSTEIGQIGLSPRVQRIRIPKHERETDSYGSGLDGFDSTGSPSWTGRIGSIPRVGIRQIGSTLS